MRIVQYFIASLLLIISFSAKTEEQKKIELGWHNVSLTHKMFDNNDDYFPTEIIDEIKQGFAQRLKGQCWTNGKTVAQCFDYEVNKQRMSIFLPPNYNPEEEWGIYMNNGHPGAYDVSLETVLEKHRLIYVMPCTEDTNAELLTKLAVSIDALASVKKMFKINADRVYMGYRKWGTSISALIAAMHPTMVQGVLMQDRIVFAKQNEHGKQLGPNSFHTVHEPNGLNFISEKYVKKHLTKIEWFFWLDHEIQEEACKRDVAEWKKWGLSADCLLYTVDNQGAKKWDGVNYAFNKAFTMFDRKLEERRLKMLESAMKE